MKQQNKLRIAIIAGTNRMGSYSLKIAQNLKLITDQLHCTSTLLDLGELPQQIFNSRSYSEKPACFSHWQTTITESDAMLFCVPEYNGGIPGILKYFMDMLEYPDSVKEKPVMLVGVSAGNSGAANALQELTRLLNFQQARVYGVTVSIGKCSAAILQNGDLRSNDYQSVSTTTAAFIRFCLSDPDN